MNYDYSLMFSRTSDKCSDINIFENSVFSGFFKYRTLERLFSEYHKSALESAKDVSWDYIILYAVIEYEKGSQKIISTNFMTLEIPYGLYIKAVRKLWKNCRLFFIRGRKEYYNE